MALNFASATGGASSQGTVTLTSPAPAGGFAVSLSSSNTEVATLAASVRVAGSDECDLRDSTSAVIASTP